MEPSTRPGTPADGPARSETRFQDVESPGSDFRMLDPEKIRQTVEQLERRVVERFPKSGLSQVARGLLETTHQVTRETTRLRRPIRPLRIFSRISILALVGVAIAALTVFRPKDALASSVADYFQGLDAAVNEMVLLGIAIYFLHGLEHRLKRKRALGSLHGLRSMAHIIDMHQLTKDPDRWLHGGGLDTPSSPRLSMTACELTRYLDYCSEMLALLSKLAALHVQEFSDPITLSAVNDIENLTSDLSRKIWQKIMILDQLVERTGEPRIS